MLTYDAQAIWRLGFFHGYNVIVWVVILSQALTGLMVGYSIRYADAILKGIATSIAVLTGSLISMMVWEIEMDDYFLVGAAMVAFGVDMYSRSATVLQTTASRTQRRRLLGVVMLLCAICCFEVQKATSVYWKSAASALFGRVNHHPNISVISHWTTPATKNRTLVSRGTEISYLATIHFQNNSKSHPLTNMTGGTCKLHEVGRNSGNVPPLLVTERLERLELIESVELFSLGLRNVYCRKQGEVVKAVNCSHSLQVLEWISSEAIKLNVDVMMAYGGLIHLFREGGLVRENGRLFDDDIDLWLTEEALQALLDLEPSMFATFGWSIRCVVGKQSGKITVKEIVFAQVFPACRHRVTSKVGKLGRGTPGTTGIELYPLAPWKNNTYVDKWLGTIMSSALVLPAQALSGTLFGKSSSRNTAVPSVTLQVPRNATKVLTCLYGNWSVYSKEHASQHKKCLV